MNTSLRSSLPVLSAFGVATVAGLLATLFWTPTAGLHNRRRLAAGLRDRMRPVTGRWWNRRHHAVPTASQAAGSSANLATQPDHLIDRR